MPDKPNHALFVETLAHIERDPNAWNQGTWMVLGLEKGQICASAGCMAGWACLLGGVGNPDVYLTHAKALEQGDEDVDVSRWRLPTGESIGIEEYAGKLLGIQGLDTDGDPDQYEEAMDALFSGSNSMGDLYEYSAKVLKMSEDTLRKQVADRVLQLDEQAARHARLAHAAPTPKETSNV